MTEITDFAIITIPRNAPLSMAGYFNACFLKAFIVKLPAYKQFQNDNRNNNLYRTRKLNGMLNRNGATFLQWFFWR